MFQVSLQSTGVLNGHAIILTKTLPALYTQCTYLDFSITGANGEVLSGPVPLKRGDVEGVGMELTQVVDASFLCVEKVD